MPVNAKHLGSDFDSFLEEEGLLEEAEAVAAKRVLAYQIAQTMEEQKLTKAAMARRMKTSRSALERLGSGAKTGTAGVPPARGRSPRFRNRGL